MQKNVAIPKSKNMGSFKQKKNANNIVYIFDAIVNHSKAYKVHVENLNYR